MSSKPPPQDPRRARRDKLIREREHAPYRTRDKPPEPTTCASCGAVFRDGRWGWPEVPGQATGQLCPACERVRDQFPAGIVTLRGGFLDEHEEEILNLAQHVEAREKEEHPLKRIMDSRREGDAMVIRTTDLQLARSIGEAIHRAYAGELKFEYPPEADLLRVTWER